jgi:hypothetical protein
MSVVEGTNLWDFAEFLAEKLGKDIDDLLEEYKESLKQ